MSNGYICRHWQLGEFVKHLEDKELRKVTRGEAARRLLVYALKRVVPPDFDTEK